MSVSVRYRQCLRSITLLAIVTLGFFVIQWQYSSTPRDTSGPTVFQQSQHIGRNNLLRRIAIPFGKHDSYRFSPQTSLDDPYPDTVASKGPQEQYTDSYTPPTHDVSLTAVSNTTKSSYPHLAKRAGPIDFENYVCKGQSYLQKIKTAAPDPPKFSYDDIDNNGWLVDDRAGFNLPEAVLTAMRAKGISTDEGDNPRIRTQLLKSFKNYLGEETPPDGGSYQNIFNTRSGAIIAIDNTSPAYCANLDPITFTPLTNPKTGTDLLKLIPPMNSWADVIWATWSHESPPTAPGNLQYIIRVNVVNPITKAIIERVCYPNNGEGEADQLDLPWPGRTFSTNKRNGQALLGTPHGVGTTWLSVLGKRSLGNRGAPSVTVWSAENLAGSFTYFLLWDLGTPGL
ncbi:MAG: hypothetical protein Q9212_005112 [Teloschistes hypoglaucus]